MAAAVVLYHLLAVGMWRDAVIDHHREQATYDRFLAAITGPDDDPLAGPPPAEAVPARGPAR